MYYGFYLPRQAALAASPRPEQTVNAMAAIRQQSALTERAGLFDPVQPFGSDYDPQHPFADRSRGRTRLGARAVHAAGSNGMGPPMYFNRTATYYPLQRSGRSANASVAAGVLRGVPITVPRARDPRGSVSAAATACPASGCPAAVYPVDSAIGASQGLRMCWTLCCRLAAAGWMGDPVLSPKVTR